MNEQHEVLDFERSKVYKVKDLAPEERAAITRRNSLTILENCPREERCEYERLLARVVGVD